MAGVSRLKGMPIPPTIEKCAEQLRSHRWGDERVIKDLIAAFVSESAGEDARRRLAWLSMFAARRALPCWELYCDGEQPIRTVAALESWLVAGELPFSWDAFTQPALPRFLGLRIDDCRECDTAASADSAAWAPQFASSGDVTYAVGAVVQADGAFEHSPLGRREQFRRWLVEVAVPAAWDCRELSPDERRAFRDFDEAEVRLHNWGVPGLGFERYCNECVRSSAARKATFQDDAV
jgi:hypothetical protein